jgi:hypothetical protein
MPRRNASFQRNWDELHTGTSGIWLIGPWRKDIRFLVRVMDSHDEMDVVELHVHRVMDLEEQSSEGRSAWCRFRLQPSVHEAMGMGRAGLRNAVGTCVNITGSRVARIVVPGQVGVRLAAPDLTVVGDFRPYQRRGDQPSVPIWVPARELAIQRRHDNLTDCAVEWLKQAGWGVEEGPRPTMAIDLLAQKDQQTWLIEAKSAGEDGSLRTAVGQLFQYQHRYRLCRPHGPVPALAVLLDERPCTEWQDILRNLGIGVFWMANGRLEPWTVFQNGRP